MPRLVNRPDKCPICNSKVFKPAGEGGFYCENPECFAQIKGRFIHFVSRSAMDIEGLGESIIDLFVDKGFIIHFQIFTLESEKR